MPAQLPAGMASLPPLGGRLFVVYRIAWWTLLVVALAAVGLALLNAATSPVAVLVLRFAKATVLLAVSAILFRRRARDPVAAMLSLAFLLWIISSSIDLAAASTWPAVVDRFRFLLFALVLLLFPDGNWRPQWTRHIAAIIIATFALGMGEALGLIQSRFYLPIAIGCVLAALVALLCRYRAIECGVEKQQLKWVTLGLFAGIALILAARAGAAVTSGMSMPLIGAVVIEGLFQLGIVTIALGFLTSLLRYRLYDAEAAISRSAAYAALTLALVGTFAAVESLIELLSQNYLGSGLGNISGAVAAAVAAVLLTPLHGKISAWAEERFQRDLALMKRSLPDLLHALSGGTSLKRFAATLLPHIEQAIQSTRMALLVDGRLIAAQGISLGSARRLLGSWNAPSAVALFDRNDAEPFPLRMALRCPLGSIRGWLFVGPRPDGSYYGRDDLDALAEVAPPIQRTLFLVAEREAQDACQRKRQAALLRSVRSLSLRLDELEAAHDHRCVG